MNKLPIIRIESLTDSQGNILMVTVSGCVINTNDEMIEYPASQVDNLDVAERFVSWLRKQGFEFQMVKVSSTI